jgi:lipopolysaccharide transport system permease protein
MAMTTQSSSAAELIIEPERVERNYWADIWRYRELFYILSWRDIRVRYKQTVLGAAWAILRPLLTTVIFVVVFGKIANLGSQTKVPYSIVVFSGLLPWYFISTALGEASNSLITNASLITKVYFPRIIIPTSATIVSLLDTAISFAILGVVMAFYRFVPPLQILALPAFVLLAFLFACGLGLSVTALNVKYRDFRYVIPFALQLGIYIAPVGYSSSVVAERYSPQVRLLYALNPTVGVIDGFRWCICGDPLYLPGLAMSIGIILLLLWIGVRYFRHTERSFADNV